MSLYVPVPSRKTVALVAVLAPTAYLLILRASVMRNIDTYSSGQPSPKKQPLDPEAAAATTAASSSTPTFTSGPEPAFPQSLPSTVTADNGYILSHERLVSKPLKLSSLGWDKGQLNELLTRYVRATMVAFTWTPQAYLLRKMLPPAQSETFQAPYINAMSFTQIGARVDGVYTVAYRSAAARSTTDVSGDERVEMRLDPPEGYTGPNGEGIIVAAVEPVGQGSNGEVVFINETCLWRKLDEKPTMLEGTVGRWFHSLLAAWLIGKGILAVETGPTP